MKLDIGLKEWSAVVEALGSGKQTIVVRAYEPRVQDFFLYPTYNFYMSALNEEKFNTLFQREYVEMARKSGESTAKRGKEELFVDINYFAKIEKVVEVSDSAVWQKLSPHYIWTSEHVKKYAGMTRKNRAPHVWLLRVFKMPETIVIGRWNMGGPPDYYRHNEFLEIAGRPVLTDGEFEKKKAEILKIIGSPVSA